MSEKLSDIWHDPAEAVGELLLEKGLEKAAPALSQVPLLSLVIAAYKSKGAISDYLLARKVQQFYTAWDRLPEGERRSIYQKFQKKPRAFIEKLLFILSQQEDLAKCRLLGVLTTAYLRGSLKRRDYLDLIETVVHLSLSDLLLLNKIAAYGLILPRRKIGERYATLFVTRGLFETEPSLPSEQRDGDEPTYRLTKLGGSFMTLVNETDLKETA